MTLCELVGGEFDGQRLETPFVKPQINMTNADGKQREAYALRVIQVAPLWGELATWTWVMSADGEAVLYDVVKP